MISALKRFCVSRLGNIAILTAVSLPITMAAMGGAIEYGVVYNQNQKLMAAADSAALAAVNEALEAYRNHDNVDLEILISDFAERAFASATAKNNLIDGPQLQASASVQNNVFSVTVDYSGTYNTLIAGFAGFETITLSGTTSATTSAASFANINLVFDVSHSMAIGATPSDQELMGALVNCAFACHIGGNANSSYNRVRNSSATMRIDVARDAAMSALEIVESSELLPDQISFSVHKFDNLLHEVVPVNSPDATDIDYLKSEIDASIGLTIFNGGTNIENALRELQSRIPPGGGGVGPDDRIQYLIVLTDGVESTQARLETGGWVQHPNAVINTPWRRHAGHEVNYALNPDVCAHYRRNNIHVYFIYTEYDNPQFGHLSSHDQNRFGFIEDTLHDLVPERFEECTEIEERVLEASTPQQIERTFNELLGEIASPLRLR